MMSIQKSVRRISRRAAVFFAITFVGLGSIGLSIATAQTTLESERDLHVRSHLVGNLGVAHTELGLYPDTSDIDPAPARNGGSASLNVPSGADVLEAYVMWSGRGAGWSDPEISVNQVAITAETTYTWPAPGPEQTSYVTDLLAAGISVSPGANAFSFDGIDHLDQRSYGVAVVVIYEDPSLPEVELQLLEGNEFTFFDFTFSDEIGNSGIHTSEKCVSFAAALTERPLEGAVRIAGVDSGRSDGPARSQQLNWWTSEEPMVAPVEDGLVLAIDADPEGTVINPVTPRVEPTAAWGTETWELDGVTLSAGEQNFCLQLLSVDIDGGRGASMSVPSLAVAAPSIYRVGNLVWLDAIADGSANANEPGIDGVVVELWQEGATDALATTETADDGSYIFEGLPCGNYNIVIPSGQTGQSIAGEAVDLIDLQPGAINSDSPNDDLDNDDNGLASNDGSVASAVITLGDCGDDGDFSDASSEPANETDRVDGPDDDADDVSAVDGNYDDVRSNTSVDFAFTSLIPVEVGGTVECNDGSTVTAGESCDAASHCDDANGAAATDANGEPCTIPVEVGGTVECNDGTTVEAGQECPEATDCDTLNDDGTVKDGCDDDPVVPVEVLGEVEENNGNLAVTGVSSRLITLASLFVLILGLWFAIAAIWMRPDPQ